MLSRPSHLQARMRVLVSVPGFMFEARALFRCTQFKHGALAACRGGGRARV